MRAAALPAILLSTPVLDFGSGRLGPGSMERSDMILKSLAVAVGMTLALGVTAQQVYRSVDQHGNVTFSSTPPPEAKEVAPVNIDAGPTPAQRQDAMEREQRLQEAVRGLDAERAEERRSRQSDISQAERALASARRELDTARVMRDEDWQGLAGGGRRLKPSYYQRVEQAETAVRAAEAELSRARRGR